MDKARRIRHFQVTTVVVMLLSLGCTGRKKPVRIGEQPPTASETMAGKRVSDRPGNTMGKVIILEYHNIAEGKGGMFRSPAAFKSDLERLYRMGFRPVTVSEYVTNQMPLAPGASPVVITFDDSAPTQYAFKKGALDPDCAVGIWEAFSKAHPDFPLKATFYVLPNLWNQPDLNEAKVRALRVRGSELGAHTMTHRALNRLSDSEVEKEFSGSVDLLKRFGEKTPVSLALPLGISPKNKGLLSEFSAILLVGANPAPAPTDPDFNRMRVPRIQGYDGESGSTFWLDQVEKGKVSVYVEP